MILDRDNMNIEKTLEAVPSYVENTEVLFKLNTNLEKNWKQQGKLTSQVPDR